MLKFIIKEYYLIFLDEIGSLFRSNPPEKWKKGDKGDLILLPGFFETWYFLKKIGNYVNKLGYKVYVVKDLEWCLSTLDKSNKILEDYILSKKLKNIILIGHSKGGLIGKYFLEYSNCKDKVNNLFSIATPYQGSLGGKLRIFNLKELIPTSPIIKKLQSANSGNQKIINIYPKLDNHIIPNESLYLNGAKDFPLVVKGHTLILEEQLLFNILKDNLA